MFGLIMMAIIYSSNGMSSEAVHAVFAVIIFGIIMLVVKLFKNKNN